MHSPSLLPLHQFFLPGLLAGLLLGCSPRPEGQVATAAVGPAGPELPRLVAPVPLPAKRVVHLLFSGNVQGEAEPCG